MPANQALNIWSLFSGIGGLEMGLEAAGLGETTLQCEIDPFALSVLDKHWPKVPKIKNVKIVSNTKLFNHTDTPDLICGGFPCQPHSLAGKRKGADDERHLWPEFARIIRDFKPTFVVAENVPGIRTNGALNEVLGDLAVCGYDAEWVRLGAAAVGAPHLRERIFIVAYPGTKRNGAIDSTRKDSEPTKADSNTDGKRRGNEPKLDGGKKAWKEGELWDHAYRLRSGLGESEPFIFTDAQRLNLPIHPNQTGWSCEPDVGRVAYGIPKRVDRLKALGNAVVPQVAQFVGSCIYDAITKEA